ncbi:hypothetical protein ACJX0J_026580, partial [Zea mays]
SHLMLQDLYDRTGYRPVTPDLLSVSQHIIDNRDEIYAFKEVAIFTMTNS